METMCPSCGISIEDDSDNSGQTITSCVRCGADLLIAAGAELPRQTILREAAYYEDPTLNFGQAPPGTAPNHLLPDRLGRYRILSPLGSGGFATVYLAVDEELHRQVAIKVPRKDRFLSETDYRQFFEEARVLARFEHPGIVPVYDVGTEGDIRFIVTRYVDGTSLNTRLHRGAVSFAEAARIVSQCAHAIHAAHKRQIYHRDLKPGNILLGKEGEVFVADFGLALSREKMQPLAREVSGTPRYMSPEQIRGDIVRLDGRSDIWSLGVVLYRLLTGTEPFVGSGQQLAMEIQEKPPVPLRQHNELIPGALEEICFKCLSKLPEQRYQTAFDLARDLEEWLRLNSGTLLQASSISTVPPHGADTAEGLSSPTLPFASRWVPNGPVRKLTTYAAGGAFVLLLALGLSFFRKDKPLVNPDMSVTTGQSKIATGVTEDIPGKWRQLLLKEPRKLVFPNVGPARMLYDSVREEVTLHTPEAGYVSLQETSATSYLFSVRLHRSNWIGGAGLFIGFKPSPWEDGRILNQCLAVSVNGFQTDSRIDYYLKLDRLIITPNPRIHDDVSPGPLLSKKIANPATREFHTIEVKVADDRLNTVSWDGEVIFRYPIEVLNVQWVKGLPEISGSGAMGVYSCLGDTMFSDARFMSTKSE